MTVKEHDADFLTRAVRRAERDRCATIVRNTAAFYRNLASNASSRDNQRGYRGIAIALEDVANEMEDQ
jgi:spore germination protein YaaH